MSVPRFQIIFLAGIMALAGFISGATSATVTADGTSLPKLEAPKGTEIISGNWSLNCQPFGNSDELLCEASRIIVLKQNNEALLSVFVTPWKQAKATTPYLLRLQLPHGLNLPEGVHIQIDKLETQTAIFQTTNQSGIFARIGLSDKTLIAMQAGKMLTVSFSAINGNKISIPVPLNGFTAVFSKMK